MANQDPSSGVPINAIVGPLEVDPEGNPTPEQSRQRRISGRTVRVNRTPFLPDLTGQLSPRAMNALARAPGSNQLTVAGADTPVPILYGGPERMAGKIYTAGTYAGRLILAIIYSEGEIERIGASGSTDPNGLEVNDYNAAAQGYINFIKYVGTSGQTANSWLISALAAKGYDASDTLADTAYMVASVQPGVYAGVPRITAQVYGRKVFDPRANLLLGSNYIGNVTYWSAYGGMGAAQNAVGPYGATNYAWTLTDNNAGDYSAMFQNVTIPQGTETYVGSLKVKKTAGAAPLAGFNLAISGGTGVLAYGRINPQTGSISGSTAGATVEDIGTYWLLSVPVTNNNTVGNTTLQMTIYAALSSAAETGSNVFCEAQIRPSTVPAGYVDTVATALNQSTVWNDNPALELGDFIASTRYGEGRMVDATSLAEAAEYCDRMHGASGKPNEKRSRCTLLLNQRQATRAYRELLRAYVPCWVNFVGDVAYLKVDKAGSVDHAFDPESIDAGTRPTLKRAGVKDTPNVVQIGYTDTSVTPWRYAIAEAQVTPAPTDRRVTRIDMPGIRSYAQAMRFAIERLNHYTLEDLSGEISVFDNGLKVLPGDIVSVEDELLPGSDVTPKQFRVLGVSDQGHGRWRLRLREYQPNAYSELVETTPALPDLRPDDPNAIPTVSNLTLYDKRVYVSGAWYTHLAATWNQVTWKYIQWIHVQVFENPIAGTYTWAADVVTVTATNTLIAGQQVFLDFTSGGGTPDNVYQVVSATGSQFTVALPGSGTGGNCQFSTLLQATLIPGWHNEVVIGTLRLNVEYTAVVQIISKMGQAGPIALDSYEKITPTAQQMYGGSIQATVYMGESPPAVAAHGSLWFNTTYGRLHVFYDDGSSQQWVHV